MAALDSNPELLLRAFLETARDLFADPKPWLKQLRNHALTGSTVQISEVLSNLQDWGASSIANEGASTQWLRSLSALQIAELSQAALDMIAADGDEAGSAPASHVSHGYFGSNPTLLG